MQESVGGLDAGRYAEIARQTLLVLLPHVAKGDDPRTGGYLTVADHAGQPLLVMLIGHSPVERLGRYWRNSLEKAQRTALSRTACSRATRDAARERWIGALLGKTTIVSFSGFPENFDEILVADVLVQMGDLGAKEARYLLYENEDFRRLKSLFSWQ